MNLQISIGPGFAVGKVARGCSAASFIPYPLSFILRPSSYSFIFYTLAFSLCLALPALAFPPAPDAVIYGMVKDQLGTPLTLSSDEVILQTPGGVQNVGFIEPGLAIGVNYLVSVPVDAGTFGGPYKPSALVVGSQYQLYVVHNGATNLPIEMQGGSYATLGLPSSITEQNLTLGTATNGSGIPDQWIQEFLSEIGTNVPLASVNPNGIYTKDGRTLKQEYLLGNYPFNPTNEFNVQITGLSAGAATLAFTTMTGRSYTVYGSPDLQHWSPLSFTIPASGSGTLSYYYAPTIAPIQIQTLQPTNAPTMQFFRLLLQ